MDTEGYNDAMRQASSQTHPVAVNVCSVTPKISVLSLQGGLVWISYPVPQSTTHAGNRPAISCSCGNHRKLLWWRTVCVGCMILQAVHRRNPKPAQCSFYFRTRFQANRERQDGWRRGAMQAEFLAAAVNHGALSCERIARSRIICRCKIYILRPKTYTAYVWTHV